MSQSIHVVVPHGLPLQRAMNKVLTWLQEQQGKNQHVTPLSTVIDNTAHTVTLKLSAYGYPVTVVITVSDSQVELQTSEAIDIAEGMAMWLEQLQLQKQLAEVLKP